MVLKLGPVALERDEVFLLLIFIYSESKRQDKMVRCVGFASISFADVSTRCSERFGRLASLDLGFLSSTSRFHGQAHLDNSTRIRTFGPTPVTSNIFTERQIKPFHAHRQCTAQSVCEIAGTGLRSNH